MYIKKRRIRNLKVLDSLKGKMIRIGFSTSLSLGETILPAIVGPVTRRNSEGYYETTGTNLWKLVIEL
jgi:hypothetical protein